MEEVKMDVNAAILETTELSERYYFLLIQFWLI